MRSIHTLKVPHYYSWCYHMIRFTQVTLCTAPFSKSHLLDSGFGMRNKTSRATLIQPKNSRQLSTLATRHWSKFLLLQSVFRYLQYIKMLNLKSLKHAIRRNDFLYSLFFLFRLAVGGLKCIKSCVIWSSREKIFRILYHLLGGPDHIQH